MGSLSLQKSGSEKLQCCPGARGPGQGAEELPQPPCNGLAIAQIKKPCCPSTKSIFILFDPFGAKNNSRCNLIGVCIFSQRSVADTSLLCSYFLRELILRVSWF